MSCCDQTTARVPRSDLSRRAVLKGSALIASLLSFLRPTASYAQRRRIKLAYCSQLLCGVPYEVARSGGFFKKHGLEVELIYTRGGNAAMQALVGGAVDYAATALDVASNARDKFGRFLAIRIAALFFWHAFINIGMVTGMLPLVGVPLPLFSYGGSSVLADLLGVGILLNVSLRRFMF